MNGDLAKHLCADEAADVGGPNGRRVRLTVELVLHVCCTRKV
jgi:hypothetical protein